jgi:hypothetical protein
MSDAPDHEAYFCFISLRSFVMGAVFYHQDCSSPDIANVARVSRFLPPFRECGTASVSRVLLIYHEHCSFFIWTHSERKSDALGDRNVLLEAESEL